MGQAALRVVTVAVVLLVALLIGCGGDDDPFVGTWRATGADSQSGSYVIAKTEAGYTATAVIPGLTEADGVTPKTLAVALTRQGDVLTSPDAERLGLTLEVTYHPESGRLSVFSGGALGPPGSSMDDLESRTQEYERSSDSTEVPSAQ